MSDEKLAEVSPLAFCSPPCTLVFFVEPEPSSLDGMNRLTSRLMLVPPRINEAVTIQPGFGARPVRYSVKEVIHHIPPVSIADDDAVVNECTCVVVRPVGAQEVSGVVDVLCREAARDKLLPKRNAVRLIPPPG